MRNVVFVLSVSVFLSILSTNGFAQPHAMRAAALPEPGVLAALGGGLVGLAAVVRRRLSR